MSKTTKSSSIDMEKLKKNPCAYYDELLETNKEFRKFVEDNQGKTTLEICQENGIDYMEFLMRSNSLFESIKEIVV